MADEVLIRVDVDAQNVLALRGHHIDCARCGADRWNRCALFTAMVEAFLPSYVQTGVQAEGNPRPGRP